MANAPTHKRRAKTRPSLSEQIAEKLRSRLESGALQPGDRLPTEQALGETYGVSRTVVREAIATLRADGLVVARQGSGMFVRELPAQPFGLSLLTSAPDRISSIIETLELRAAVESEAAALAAERRSPAELEKIREQFAAISVAVAAGALAEEQDFSFHLAIAEASHNQHFIEFFRFLGERTIPRSQLFAQSRHDDGPVAYLERIQAEHARIVAAIATQQPVKAHDSMRRHLKGSQDRYQRLMHWQGRGRET
jgi:GntR family transcriptional regulator, transcriptional repressor for pyruvate dehydrogenase complex